MLEMPFDNDPGFCGTVEFDIGVGLFLVPIYEQEPPGKPSIPFIHPETDVTFWIGQPIAVPDKDPDEQVYSSLE